MSLLTRYGTFHCPACKIRLTTTSTWRAVRARFRKRSRLCTLHLGMKV